MTRTARPATRATTTDAQGYHGARRAHGAHGTSGVVTPGAGPVPFGAARRGAQLLLGLLAYAVSMAMLLHAGQGGMPWDVLHQGVVRRTGLPFGVVVAATSALVLLAWVPLRQRPGLGTLANVVVIALAIDPALAGVAALLPDPSVGLRVALAVGAVVLNGVATAAYIGVRLGPGPRDGLMTGLVARTGWSVRLVRTVVEVVVVLVGWSLGGTLGWATLVYALGVGPVVQVAARVLAPAGLAATRPRGARQGPRSPTGSG